MATEFRVIEVHGLNLKQGSFQLREVTFQIPTGQYGVLMGPTGSGKTTTLEAVAGLRSIASGRITLCGADVTHLPTWKRNLGYVPQDGALFRTMTVRQHLGFALHLRRETETRMRERVEELAAWLRITPLLDRLPVGLSGGEVQRVALGRALSFHPTVLLLDEPLSSVDEAMRDMLVEMLRELPGKHQATVLHVTHNRAEAERLATVVLRMEGGRIVTS